jgi:hypothetical protein
MKHIVEIPEIYLMQIASAGDMGSGKLLATMRIWAEKECLRLALDKELRQAKLDNLKELRQRVKNSFGEKVTKKAEAIVKELTEELIK